MQYDISRDVLRLIDMYMYEISPSFRSDMRVPAHLFLNEQMLEDVLLDRSLWQLVNTATLPGVVKSVLAMPDIHQGYGFPIGGVAATDIAQGGVISPGGIGYDINCGVRLLVSPITRDEIAPYLERLADKIYAAIPSGVGRGSKLKLTLPELDKVLRYGAKRMFEQGIGVPSDLERCEENGSMAGADPDMVSERAKKRGSDQIGTLGSGNHFLEIQAVDEIYDQQVAQAFGLHQGLVTVMIHCGSRGLGHQVCTDYVRLMMPKLEEFGITLPDRELVCVPFTSDEGQAYFGAMQAAANFAWANRHTIGHWVRECWQSVLGDQTPLNTVYDVSHNMGKLEQHTINGRPMNLLVHRKGATRSFPVGRPEIPAAYQAVGHPVLIPGTMGTSSYIMVGTDKGLETAFGSCCHGAGRKMSRAQARKHVHPATLREQLAQQGIIIRTDSDRGLAEEAPTAYKDVENVVDVVDKTGLARKVARVVPLAVIKGD